MTSVNESPEKNDSRNTTIPERIIQDSQDAWISEEELYTEGSSEDEDDMALRMKRRAQRENKTKTSSAHHIRETKGKSDTSVKDSNLLEEACQAADSFKWRPTQGNLQFKETSEHINSSSNGDEAQAHGSARTSSSQSLSEAYSNMHKLDALLRDSDRRLKEAQAKTLREQLSTRAQLRRLREQVGPQVVALSANWDAFMQLCPVVEPDWACASAPGAAGRRARRGGPRGDADGAPEPGPHPRPRPPRAADSVLPRIGGVESEADDSEDSESSCSALAITDEEKLKLAALLRDVEQDEEAPGARGYHVDEAVRRDLDHIDGRLHELVLEPEDDAARPATPPGPGRGGLASTREPRGATRQQRLEDIDRCLQSLADSALEDVEPLCEEAVRALLQDATRDAPRDAPGAGTDPELISALLDQARRELPRFRYRQGDGADHGPELPRLSHNTAAR